MNYKFQAKVIAITEMIVSSAGIFGIIVLAVLFAMRRDDILKDEVTLNKYPQLREFVESSPLEQSGYFIMPAGYFIAELLLAALLLTGAEKAKYGLLKAWVVMTVILTVIGIGFAIFGFASASSPVLPILIISLCYGITLYSLWVAIALCKEFKEVVELNKE